MHSTRRSIALSASRAHSESDMVSPTEPKKIVSRTVRLEDELDALLADEASIEDLSVSDVLRRILKRYYFGHAGSVRRASGGDKGRGVIRAQGTGFQDSAFSSGDLGGGV